MSIKLTYFDIAGRAESTRLIFYVGGVQFEDERISGEEFVKRKEQGIFKYTQVPVLEVDGQQFAQSSALVRYAASKAGLLPTYPIELLKAEQMSNNIGEIIDKLVPTFLIQGEEQKKAREELASNFIPKWLGYLEKDLIQNGSNGFVAGNKLTFADIQLFICASFLSSGELLHIPKDIVSQYTSILKVHENVSKIPKIQEWYAKNPPVFKQR